MHRVSVVIVLLLSISACGSKDEHQDEEDRGLALSAQACNTAVADQGEGADDADVLEARQQAADLAAEAASLDPSWTTLAKATSDWALGTKSLMELDIDSPTFLEDAQRLTDETAETKSALSQACRAVKAKGGDVDTDALNNL